MTEKLLQFIWQFRYFNSQALHLETGESLQVITPGQFNTSQGPDFLNAKIKIDATIWIGHIELHLNASDWIKHAHGNDRNYNNVILHVVWKNDVVKNIRNIPTLVLEPRISKILLQQYEDWMNNPNFIPCEKYLHHTNDLIWTNWKERLLVERLQRKTTIIKEYLRQSTEHWEEIFWWLIARNFGIRINADAFENMARIISINILARHKNRILHLEALLFGQAGLLENTFGDEYPLLLQTEYRFFQKKYHLCPIHQPVHFLRMRPGNFPTIRLAQLAALVNRSSHLFSHIKEAETIYALQQMIGVTASGYWDNHYSFEEASGIKKKTLGKQMIDNIIINTIIPAIFAYGHLQEEPVFKEKALQWLEEIEPEKNSITNKWKSLGIVNANAFDSQALLELKTQYCDQKKCLDCAIGNLLLKRSS